MDVKLILLRPVTDGAGTHGIGSEYTCDEKEAARLIRLEAAYKLHPAKRSNEVNGEQTNSDEISVKEDTLYAGSEDVDSEEEYMSEEEYAEILKELQAIEGVSSSLAEKLVEAGFQSIEAIANASQEELVEVSGIGKKSVRNIISSAQELLAQ
jgi:replicative superfamily II helicase